MSSYFSSSDGVSPIVVIAPIIFGFVLALVIGCRVKARRNRQRALYQPQSTPYRAFGGRPNDLEARLTALESNRAGPYAGGDIISMTRPTDTSRENPVRPLPAYASSPTELERRIAALEQEREHDFIGNSTILSSDRRDDEELPAYRK